MSNSGASEFRDAQSREAQSRDAKNWLNRHCVVCHNAEIQKAGFALHDIDVDVVGGKDVERWEKILEMVSLGDMPPKEESPKEESSKEESSKEESSKGANPGQGVRQPSDESRDAFQHWLGEQLAKIGRGPVQGSEAFPKNGNRVNHDALFSGEHIGPAYTRSRVWRISPQIYQRFASEIEMARKLNAPLRVAGEDGFEDYSLLYADEATIMTMLQNCKRVAVTLIHGRVSTTKNRSSNIETKQGGRAGSRHKVFVDFIKSDQDIAGDRQIDAEEAGAVLNYATKLLLRRDATASDLDRYVNRFLLPNAAESGRENALVGLLTTIMMSPEFLYRMEIGLGEKLPDGRRMLGPRELAYALSFALFDYVDPLSLKAAGEGRLMTKADVEREFRRMLDDKDRKVRGAVNGRFWVVGKGAGVTDPKLIEASYPRLLRFFREYFGYTKVADVFKDDSRHDNRHRPFDLIQDADWFVLRAIRDDRNVLERLLTEDHYFVQSRSYRKPIRESRPYNIDGPLERRSEGKSVIFEPTKMPRGQRAGMLTHPAWLASHSGNFENDPVRRGKWIQERLLAGVVPDIPIGVAAMLPNAPHRTLRQRFEVVQAEECWRCHKKMNPLGNPFEAYDDFGRFRTEHLVGADGNVIASELEADSRLRKIRWRDSHKKGAPPEPFTSIPVDPSGSLEGTGDSTLDGEVDGPIELLDRLAKSERVRQSFVRHVFRYWMGRNETLDDSPTLMAMDRAYQDNDGSFRELLVALITSDSFLYRK